MEKLLQWCIKNRLLIVLTMALLSFLVGAVPVGQVVARYVVDIDLREHGSGNIGATNVARVVGARAGLITLFADISKGALAVVGALGVGCGVQESWACGILAVAGHCFTPYLRWKGGKGVATALGVVAMLLPQVAWVALGSWIGVVLLSRRSSLGALTALPVVVFGVWFVAPDQVLWAVLLAGLILIRHTDNIRRLRAHTELELHRAPPEPEQAVHERPLRTPTPR